MNKKIATIDAVPNQVLAECISVAADDPRFDKEMVDALTENPKCPLLVVRDLGRTAALYQACEGCPVFDQIQTEERIIEESMEIARGVLLYPNKAMGEMSDLFTQGLKTSNPACEKKVVAELFQLIVVLEDQGRKDFLEFGQDAINGSRQIQALITFIDRSKMSGKDEDAKVASALLGLLRDLPKMYFEQIAADNGKANGERVDTSGFTTVTGNLYSYCTLKNDTTLTDLRELVKAGRPNIRHSGIDAIADSQVKGAKGEIAVGKAIVGMEGVSVRRGTPAEDRRGGDFVIGEGEARRTLLDIKCRSGEILVRTEPLGKGGAKLIIPEGSVTETLTLNEKAKQAARQQVLALA